MYLISVYSCIFIQFLKIGAGENGGFVQNNFTSSLKSMFSHEDSLKILPTLAEFEEMAKKLSAASGDGDAEMRMGCMYDNGDGIKFCPDVCAAPVGANVIVGAVLRAESGFKFVPGERIAESSKMTIFVPGQRMTSVNGEFIPGACIREESNEWYG